jgi:hypothetical protein
MSADYTDDEVTVVVEQIIRSSIRRPYGALGQRDVGTTFADFQEQTIAVLCLTTNAPFYVIFLGTERLSANIGDVASTLEELDDNVQALGRGALPVASTTDLANARVAADALAIATSSRTKAFADIKATPAFQRLDRNIQSFLDSYSSPNIKSGASIVRTPSEAKANVPGLIQQLITIRQTLIEKVTSLSNAITDYEALNLPGLLSAGVVQRASQVLTEATTAMARLTPETRVSQIRDVTLKLLATRAIIKNFGSLATPTIFLILEGTGQALADAAHPATPALLTADLPGPYNVRADEVVLRNQLDLTIDNVLSTVVTTGGSFAASLQGVQLEPFSFINAPPADENDKFQISTLENGITTSTLLVTLTNGFRSALQVVADINAAVTTQPIVAEPSILPLKFNGKVNIAGTDPGTVTFTLTNPFSSWVTMTVKEGDKLRVLEGTNDGVLYQVNVGGVSALVLTCTRLTGAGTTAELNKTIEVGGPSLAVRVRIKDSYIDTSLTNRTTLLIGTAGDEIKTRTAAELGFSAGMNTASTPLPAQNVVDAINAATTTAMNELSKLVASISLKPVVLGVELTGLLMRSDSSSPSALVVYRFRDRGAVTVGGTNATLSIPTLPASVELGDEIVIRATSISADVNVRGVINTITGTTVHATFGSAVSVSTNVLFEISPDLTGLPRDVDVVIADGPNAGTYRVLVQDAVIKSELSLDKALRSFLGPSGQPVFFTGSIMQEYLALASTDTTLASAVRVDDGPPNPASAASLFFSVRPAIALGTTPWFELPAGSKGMEVGDVLEIYIGPSVSTPTATHEITAIDGTIISVSPELSANLVSLTLDVGAGVPFARIRKTRRDTFDTFSASAKTWLGRPELQPAWLTELDRQVTMAMSEPTPPNVSSLRQYLLGFFGLLTTAGADFINLPEEQSIEAIAAAYTAPVVSEIDTLVGSLSAKGGDRAIDLLLDAKFQDYFGLGVDTMSYAGTVANAVTAVVRNDLPVRSTKRSELVDRQISLGQSDDPDFEYDQSDIDNSLVPDSPGPNPPPKPGDAY